MDKGYDKTLRIAAKKHDLTGIRVYDPMEKTLPNLGMVPMVDAETGRMKWINTFSKELRRSYGAQYAEQVKSFEELFKKNGAGQLNCSVEESYVKKLLLTLLKNHTLCNLQLCPICFLFFYHNHT